MVGRIRGAAIGFAVTSAVLALAAWLGVPLSRPGQMGGSELAAAGLASAVAGVAGGAIAVSRLGARREPLPEDRWLAGLAGPALAAAVHIALLGAEQTIDSGLLVVAGGLLVGGALGSRGATAPDVADLGDGPDTHWRKRLTSLPRSERETGGDAPPAAHPDTENADELTAHGTKSSPEAPAQGPEGPNQHLGPPTSQG